MLRLEPHGKTGPRTISVLPKSEKQFETTFNHPPSRAQLRQAREAFHKFESNGALELTDGSGEQALLDSIVASPSQQVFVVAHAKPSASGAKIVLPNGESVSARTLVEAAAEKEKDLIVISCYSDDVDPGSLISVNEAYDIWQAVRRPQRVQPSDMDGLPTRQGRIRITWRNEEGTIFETEPAPRALPPMWRSVRLWPPFIGLLALVAVLTYPFDPTTTDANEPSRARLHRLLHRRRHLGARSLVGFAVGSAAAVGASAAYLELTEHAVLTCTINATGIAFALLARAVVLYGLDESVNARTIRGTAGGLVGFIALFMAPSVFAVGIEYIFEDGDPFATWNTLDQLKGFQEQHQASAAEEFNSGLLLSLGLGGLGLLTCMKRALEDRPIAPPVQVTLWITLFVLPAIGAVLLSLWLLRNEFKRTLE